MDDGPGEAAGDSDDDKEHHAAVQDAHRVSGFSSQGAGITAHNWLGKNGRAGEIRTHDLLHPMQARYQATLQPEQGRVTKLYGRG